MNEPCHINQWIVTHVWKLHVTYVNKSCNTQQRLEGLHHEHVVTNVVTNDKASVSGRSTCTNLISNINLIRNINESCHTYEWVMSHIWMSHVTHMNESCHTYEWVMSHIWMSHVSYQSHQEYQCSCHTYESCHTLWESCYTHESCVCVRFIIQLHWYEAVWHDSFTSVICMPWSHVTYVNESCHTSSYQFTSVICMPWLIHKYTMTHS